MAGTADGPAAEDLAQEVWAEIHGLRKRRINRPQQPHIRKPNAPQGSVRRWIARLSAGVRCGRSLPEQTGDDPAPFDEIPRLGATRYRFSTGTAVWGPDGNMWFTEGTTDKIAKLIL